jgi:hypothetical protein
MKSLRPSWKTCLATVVGFLLGGMLFHTPQAKATENLRVFVQKIHLAGAHNTPVDTAISGKNVVGFSCTTIRDGAECWIASQ